MTTAEIQKIKDPYDSTVDYNYDIPKMKYVGNAFIANGNYGPISSFHQRLSKENNQKTCLVSIRKLCKVYNTPSRGKNILREMSIMNYVNNQNVVKLLDMYIPEREEWQDVYFIEEYLSSNLEKLIDYSYKYNYLGEPKLVPWIIYQTLCGINYLHSARIMHRNIKPSNILIDESGNVKICGFSNSRSFDDYEKTTKGETNSFTAEIGSLSYRAPEILSSKKKTKVNYDQRIDIWGVGCVMAELYSKKMPFFNFGDSKKKTWESQLYGIFKILGKPSKSVLEQFAAKERIKDIFRIPDCPKPDFKNFFPKDTDPVALDLIEELLKINPYERISIEKAFEHKYFDIIREYMYEEDMKIYIKPDESFKNDYETEVSKIEKANPVFKDHILFYKKIIRSKYEEIKNNH